MADLKRTPSDSPLRPTGIPPVRELPWGAHVCMFYEAPQDLIDALAAYFGAGLEEGEFCVWAVSEPVDRDEAIAGMRAAIPEFDHYLKMGAIELIPGYDWYLGGDEFDPQRITGGWHEKRRQAEARGYAGMRVSGNAFWMEANLWPTFRRYEEELQKSLAGARMLVLCTYSLHAARAVDVLDVARTHDVSVIRRDGRWEALGPDSWPLGAGDDFVDRAFPGRERLTPREFAALAEIVKGASNKQAARKLGISPRTIEFHRTNILRKLGARNAVELVAIVLGASRI